MDCLWRSQYLCDKLHIPPVLFGKERVRKHRYSTEIPQDIFESRLDGAIWVFWELTLQGFPKPKHRLEGFCKLIQHMFIWEVRLRKSI